ncbi:hypothetical protein [Piscirickettsia salmonis]|uniref:hypothetical protein n=2 Tax=Piscirickettsia salmonis TaxID=1238 RepID=UPI000332D4AA|nr:hypothetical protein [Piscirickettsia salmonis]APS58876.1 hypothetical protein AVI52_16645 [Piscirickettsia salmonis]ERL60628.1 hypothetical protein K661_03050 [Piscirickettsia salmonis LF-89 = ATCC VR-1361]PEQ15158.1 hypothetical protein X973_14265 [Piscirickettsia salmonis]QGN79032.1 hypothetical protein Psal001_03293 [Piscirickettsia salmonis]QGN82616.1 hypothetical protein Psal002_03312 [Piscirickettsia salmonis]
MPKFIEINKTQLETKIKEFYNEVDPKNKEKYKYIRSNIDFTLEALKKTCDTSLTELFMEHYFNPESVSDPTLQVAQCKNTLLTQLNDMLKSKKSKDKGKAPAIVSYITLIMKDVIALNFTLALDEFNKLYSWDKVKKLNLSKEYFNKILCNPSCFKDAIKLDFNQEYIEKSLDHPGFLKAALEDLTSKNNIQTILDALTLEKNNICEDISFSEAKSFLQHHKGCIARKCKNHPDKIAFGHIDEKGLIQQHLIEFKVDSWILKSGPEAQLGTKLGVTLTDIARNEGSLLHSSDSVKHWQSKREQMANSPSTCFFFDTKDLSYDNFKSSDEPEFIYHKSLEKKNSSSGQSNSVKL